MADYLARLVGTPHAMIVPRVASLFEVVLAAPEPMPAALEPTVAVASVPREHPAAELPRANTLPVDAPGSFAPTPELAAPFQAYAHTPAPTPAGHAGVAIEPTAPTIALEPSAVLAPPRASRREEIEPPPHAATTGRDPLPADPGAVLRPRWRFDLAQQAPSPLAVRNGRQVTIAQPPPVEVHIGRIDVRAAEAPPAPRRARATPPAQSLDAYLAERRR